MEYVSAAGARFRLFPGAGAWQVYEQKSCILRIATVHAATFAGACREVELMLSARLVAA